MASSIAKLNRILRLTRRYCSESSSEMSEISKAVSPSVVGLLSYFSGGAASRGTGVFVDRKLIVTSASTVGRVSTFYDSDSSSVLYNCVVSRTIALTERGKLLRTNPVAVHLAGDLAILEVAETETETETEGSFPPACTVADAPAEGDSQLVAFAIRADYIEFLYLPGPGVVKTKRPKAPWPLEEELGWVDYGFCKSNVGVRGSVSVERFSGTPWFNFQKEVAGVSSWASADADGVMKGYMVPPLRIKSIIHYANTKGPNDPIVIDRWINNHTISEHDEDEDEDEEECEAAWPTNVMIHVGRTSIFGSK